ncbi:MAG: S1C family serine protease, partial [Rhodanobacteraceae bacterium]
EHGSVVRGWLGADYAGVTVAANSGWPAAARGATVTDVYPGGPAAKAGLQPGDVLLQMNRRPVIDPADLRNREAEMKPGTTVEVSGLRDGAPFHTDVVLARRPEMPSTGTTDRG